MDNLCQWFSPYPKEHLIYNLLLIIMSGFFFLSSIIYYCKVENKPLSTLFSTVKLSKVNSTVCCPVEFTPALEFTFSSQLPAVSMKPAPLPAVSWLFLFLQDFLFSFPCSSIIINLYGALPSLVISVKAAVGLTYPPTMIGGFWHEQEKTRIRPYAAPFSWS